MINIYFKQHVPVPHKSSITLFDIKELWQTLNDEKLVKIIDLPNTMGNFSAFAAILFMKNNYVTIAYDYETRRPLVLGWFNHYNPNACIMHFLPIGRYARKHLEYIGMTWLEDTFITNNISGVTTIYCHIPLRYKGTIAFAKKMGFLEVQASRKYERKRPDGSMRNFVAMVMVHHVKRLEKYLASHPEMRATLMPQP